MAISMAKFPLQTLPLLLKTNIFERLSTNEKVLVRRINSRTNDLVRVVGLLPRRLDQVHLSAVKDQVKIFLCNGRDGDFVISFSRNTEKNRKISHSQLFGGKNDFRIADDFDESFVIFQLTKTIRSRLLRVQSCSLERNAFGNLFNSDLSNCSTLLQNSGAVILIFNCIESLQELTDQVHITSTLGLKWLVDDKRCWRDKNCSKCAAGISQLLPLTSISSFVFLETVVESRHQDDHNDINPIPMMDIPDQFPIDRRLMLLQYNRRRPHVHFMIPPHLPPSPLPSSLPKKTKIGIFPIKDVLRIIETFPLRSSAFMKKRIYALELEPKTIETFNAIISTVHFIGFPQYHGEFWGYHLDSGHYRSDRALLFQGFDMVFVAENFDGNFSSIISQITDQFRQFPFLNRKNFDFRT